VGLALRPRAAEHHRPAPIDVPGLALLGAAIIAFLVAVRADDPTLRTAAALAVVPLLASFAVVELRRERPAVDPRLFLQRSFAAAVLGIFGTTVILHGAFILIPLLVEVLLGQSPTTSGLVLLGIAGVSAVVGPFAGRLSDRRGRRPLAVAGALVATVGLLALTQPAGSSTPLAVALALGVVGLGLGIGGSARQAAAFESIEPARAGMAAGTYYTGRYLGGVVGASLAGAILGVMVTTSGVSTGFAVLAAVGIGVAVVSLGLRGAPPATAGEAASPA
jgi:MFS family permease